MTIPKRSTPSSSSSSESIDSVPRRLTALASDGRLLSTLTLVTAPSVRYKLPNIPPTRFIPTRQLGAGTFGTVYEALDGVTGALVAMKRVYIGKINESATLKTSLEREIDFLIKLREHENVVTIYGYGTDENFLYIYMELVAGQSLSALVESLGPMEESMIRRIIRQTVNGLVHLHSVGIIHRDIKAKNILLTEDGTVKLADFGASRTQDSMNDMMTVSANFSYTPLYVAPEVFQNKYDARVDIWALGCVLIEMASGVEPWTEKGFQSAQQCFKTIAETNEIPRIPKTLSADGIDFALKCLDRNPTTRPFAAELLRHPFLAADFTPTASASVSAGS